MIEHILQWSAIVFIFGFAAIYACKHVISKFCKHEWVYGRGYINIGNNTQVYYDGPRCQKCRKCKDAPWIVEVE